METQICKERCYFLINELTLETVSVHLALGGKMADTSTVFIKINREFIEIDLRNVPILIELLHILNNEAENLQAENGKEVK